jgi:hypothetical protein
MNPSIMMEIDEVTRPYGMVCSSMVGESDGFRVWLKGTKLNDETYIQFSNEVIGFLNKKNYRVHRMSNYAEIVEITCVPMS